VLDTLLNKLVGEKPAYESVFAGTDPSTARVITHADLDALINQNVTRAIKWATSLMVAIFWVGYFLGYIHFG
jgi:hypothetical protein